MSFLRKKIKILLMFLMTSAVFGYNALAQAAGEFGINNIDSSGSLYGVSSESPGVIIRRLAIMAVIFLVGMTFIIGLIIFIVKKIKRNKKKNVEENI